MKKLMPVLGVICVISSSLVTIVTPIYLKQVIELTATSLEWGAIVKLVLLFLSQALLFGLGNFLIACTGERYVLQLRSKLIQRLLYAPLSFFENYQTGELVSRMMNDSQKVRTFMVETIANFISGMMVVVGSLIAMIWLDGQLTFVLFTGLVLIFLLAMPLSLITAKLSVSMQKLLAELSASLTESLLQLPLIKYSTGEQQVNKKMNQLLNRIYRKAIHLNGALGIVQPSMMIILLLGVSLIFLYGASRVQMGTLQVSVLISFLVYLFQLMNPLMAIPQFFTNLGIKKGAVKELELINQVEMEESAPNKIEQLGDLELVDATFSYNDQPVIQAVSLTIPLHSMVALVGPSGSGKTTLIQLLLRLYPLSSGMLKLGDQDATTIQLENWRQQFAVVSQANNVLSGTVRENLVFGLKQELSDEQLWQALTQAFLAQEVQQLPQGLETPIGEFGTRLSGGQLQRLQIARAYLRQAPFILFDEATSHLDADSEQQVIQTIEQLRKEHTIVVVAHRLSTIVGADWIYFVENGQITGAGTHETLLQEHENYARYVSEQMISS